MPIHVRELIIRTSIADSQSKKRVALDQESLEVIKKEIIAECLDKVRDIQLKKMTR